MKERNRIWTKGLPFTLVLLFLFSCGKDVDIFTPYGIRGDITELYNKVQTNSISSNHSAEDTIYILTERKTFIVIPQGSLLDTEGQQVSGNVTVEYLEITDQGRMVLYDTPTISDGKLLESAVQLYINVYQNEKELKLADDAAMQIYFSLDEGEEVKDRMELFYGSVTEEDRFEWIEADGNPDIADNVTPGEWIVSQELSGYGYHFECDLLGWINVDRFVEISDDEKTSVCIELPETYSNVNTTVFMVFNDQNSAVKLYGDDEIKMFCEPYNLTPIGFDVTFVVLSSQGENVYHIATKQTSIEKSHYEYMIPKEKPLNEILDILGMF